MNAKLLPRDLPESTVERLTKLIDAIESVYPEQILVAFASQSGGTEVTTPSDQRIDSLWMFTSRYTGEIRNPLASGERLNFDVAILSDNVDYVRIYSQDFNLEIATEKSQMSLEFTTSDGLNGTISASGAACDDLLEIYNDQFKTNLLKPKEGNN